MSYSRETDTPSYVVFYYQNDTLFNQASLLSQYRARTIKDDAGKSLIDEVALSEDEADAFDIFMRTAIHDIFSHVIKMTKTVANALILNETIEVTNQNGDSSSSGAATVTEAWGFKILDYDAFNENALEAVEDGVKSAIRYRVLEQWYDLVGLDTEAGKYKAKYNEAIIDLVNKRLFGLRKPLLSA